MPNIRANGRCLEESNSKLEEEKERTGRLGVGCF